MLRKVDIKTLALICYLVQVARAYAVSVPFNENFDSLPAGDVTVPNFVEDSPLNYRVVQGSDSGDREYQATIRTISGGSVGQATAASSSLELPDLLTGDFSLSTNFRVSSYFVPTGQIAFYVGLGLLGSSPLLSGYQVVFCVGGSDRESGTISIFENGSEASTLVRGSKLGVVGVDCVLSVTASVQGESILIAATATRLDNHQSTASSVLDTTPQGGTYAGYVMWSKESFPELGGGIDATVLYDNFAVIPEPATGAMLITSVSFLGLVQGRRS